MSVTVPKRQLYVNGRWVSPIKGGTMPVINPANEQEIGTIPSATAEDVNSCVAEVCVAAKTGSWTKSTGSYRAAFIRAMAQKVIPWE
jgi:betaine-aldehyde dehydrogenase